MCSVVGWGWKWGRGPEPTGAQPATFRRQLLSGVLHLRREWTAPRQKLPNLLFPQWLLGASCSLCTVVGTQFAHSQEQTQNSWNNQPGQKIEKTDCQLPRISRWERAMREIRQPEFSITRGMVMELPMTKALKEQPRVMAPLMEGKEGRTVCLRSTRKGFLEDGQCTLGRWPPPLSPGRGNTAIWKCREKMLYSMKNYALPTAHPFFWPGSDSTEAVTRLFVNCSEV